METINKKDQMIFNLTKINVKLEEDVSTFDQEIIEKN